MMPMIYRTLPSLFCFVKMINALRDISSENIKKLETKSSNISQRFQSLQSYYVVFNFEWLIVMPHALLFVKAELRIH